ncbi:MAG: DNA polymerase III subunit beta [Oligoflexia bacterium]
MKFTIHREPLLQALQRAQSVVEKKNTVQILGNVLLTVSDSQLSIAATDLEVGIKILLPIQGGEAGKVTLSAKQFLEIVKELPNRDLVISKKENNWVEILCGKSKFNLVSLAADEFPALPHFEEKNYFDARVDSLAAMIDRTEFAVSLDATRYLLNGVYFEALENNLMRMTATDGHRLSYVDAEIFLTAPDLKRGIIIPRKGLIEFRRMLDQGSSTVGLAFERGYLFVQMGTTYLFVRLIEGEYPDYRQVVPKNTDRVLKVNRQELHAALKRVSLLANEKSRGIKLSMQDYSLVISSSNPDLGDAREELDVTFSGETLEVGFNAKYLLDCLEVTESDEIQLSLKDKLSPGIVSGKDEGNHTYVIMPMRI